METEIRSSLPGAAVLAVAFSVSACLPAATPETATARTWEVAFEMSGGFAGMMNQMTISGDGRLVAENLKRRTRVEKRLSAAQAEELDRLISRAQPAPAPAREPLRRCADCIQYRLSVTEAPGRAAISESGTLEGQQTGNRELVAFLTAVMNETLRP